MRRIISYGALVIAGALVGLCAAEAVVRIKFGRLRASHLYLDDYQLSDNPILMYEYRPNYRGDWRHTIYNQQDSLATNSAGFRGREFPPVIKEKEVIRIITLGDSITSGNGIRDPENVYPQVLGRSLNSSGGRWKYEVLNMGVGGYHTLQEAETLRTKGLRYKPDIVIVGFCYNDFQLHADGGVGEALRRQWRESSTRFFSFHPLWNAILRHSMLATFLQQKVGGASCGYSVLTGKPVRDGFRLLSDMQKKQGFKCYVFIIPPFTHNWESSPRLVKYANILHAFREYVEREMNGRKRSGDRCRPAEYISEKVFEAARSYPNIRIVDLFGDFAAREPDGEKLSTDVCHPNERGHALLAEFIATHLKADGALEGDIPLIGGRGDSGFPRPPLSRGR